MSTAPRISRALSSLVRSTPQGPVGEAWRARLVGESLLVAVALTFPLALAFGLAGHWLQGGVVASFGAFTLWQLIRLRRGAHVAGVARWTLAFVLLELFLGANTDPVLDPLSLAWLALAPMVAATVLGGRETWVWVAATVLVGLLEWSLGTPATVGHGPDPGKMLVRAVGLAVVVFVFAWRLELERRKALWAMADADQLKRRFLANVSHEIRTPMNGLLGVTEVLLRGEATAEQRDGLEVIHRSGQALLALVNDLLDLSRIEAGKLTLAPGPVDLRALAHDLEVLFGALAREKGLSLVRTVDDRVPARVLGDALRLRQVLANLVGNAVKFTTRGEVTVLVTVAEGGRLRFQVRDTGPGIPAQVLPRLFTTFEQGDPQTTRRFGGTGLGLALSKDLVALMGGALQVETAEGRGALFWFDVALPELPADAPAVALPVPRATLPSLAPGVPEVSSVPARVLVVDDNPINAKVACALLARLGVPTQVARDGQEAVAAVVAGDFSLVLMDCHMPVMDGFEATRRIRALPAPRNAVRVVALTASAMPEELARCLEVGMNATLTKPVTLAQLAQEVGLPAPVPLKA